MTQTYYIYNYIYVVVNTRINSATQHFLLVLTVVYVAELLLFLSTLYCLSIISLMNNTDQEIVKSTLKMHIEFYYNIILVHFILIFIIITYNFFHTFIVSNFLLWKYLHLQFLRLPYLTKLSYFFFFASSTPFYSSCLQSIIKL